MQIFRALVSSSTIAGRCQVAVCLCLLFNKAPAAAQPAERVLIAYVGSYRANRFCDEGIHAGKLTHIIYAFAVLKNGRAALSRPLADTKNLRCLVSLRARNRGLHVLLSVGGLAGSRDFSAVASSDNGRAHFAESCAKLVSSFDLDGIDIDWEFPGYPGEGGNRYRPADRENYTRLLEQLRTRLDNLGRQCGKDLQLTVAVDGWAPRFTTHTEMDRVQACVNYVCLMTYDFNVHGLCGGHYLYSPPGWDANGSVDGAVRGFLKAGVSPEKLVVGAGLFPTAFRMGSPDPEDSRYDRKLGFRGGLRRVFRLRRSPGFRYYWQDSARAPFLFNRASRVRIDFEDTASMRAKCRYVVSNSLAGLMYWDYFSDPERKLLEVSAHELKH